MCLCLRARTFCSFVDVCDRIGHGICIYGCLFSGKLPLACCTPSFVHTKNHRNGSMLVWIKVGASFLLPGCDRRDEVVGSGFFYIRRFIVRLVT